ncbi:response regulator transcription factor [Phormidium tenue FACHB-886]|nr:response regulator transcription factor [Phormidium tenue FACHB-886]
MIETLAVSNYFDCSPTALSPRELEVLQLVVEGDSNAEIAKKLYISLGTVKTHIRNILNKLNVNHRTQAAVFALRLGLVRFSA